MISSLLLKRRAALALVLLVTDVRRPANVRTVVVGVPRAPPRTLSEVHLWRLPRNPCIVCANCALCSRGPKHAVVGGKHSLRHHQRGTAQGVRALRYVCATSCVAAPGASALVVTAILLLPLQAPSRTAKC